MIPNPTVARAKALALATETIQRRQLHAPIATRMLSGRFYAFLMAKPYDYDRRVQALEAAVRASDEWHWVDSVVELAERKLARIIRSRPEPQWRADANVVRGPIEVLIPSTQRNNTVTHIERHQLAKRIARLLNEDDAKGQITVRVHGGHRTVEEFEQAWSDYYRGSRR